MVSHSNFLALARADDAGRLLEADEPLAGFHLRCGGELPGPILTPSLLELVFNARDYGLKLSRQIRAQDDREVVSMWAEVTPDDHGVSIAISNWQSDPVQTGGLAGEVEHRASMARHMAELSARLGPRQELLTVASDCDELQELVAEMRMGQGQPWTSFVALEGNAHRQPMHWRLLDGAKLRLKGSDRAWAANFVPLGSKDPGSAGFELYLVADRQLPEPVSSTPPEEARSHGIDREIAPVLRQPVSRIIANAETIRTQLAGPLAEEYSNYAADIASAGEHLLALIDDLTTLEMVEDEDFSPDPDEIDLADLARRAAGILGVRARERGISIDAPRLGESVPAIGEFRRVLQILLNLLGNAIRYSPEGAQIWLRAELEDGRAQVTVADQGEGLGEDEIARVFNKFERLGRSGDGGSGLGLYISRRLADAMGGSLTVDSAKGQGARFTLDLPQNPNADK